MKIKRYIALFAALLLLCSLCACGAPEAHTVRFVLDWTPNTNHTGVYVAEALGYYEEAGITVEIVAPPEDGAEALVAAGKAEFGVSFQDYLAPALEQGLPLTAVAAVIDHNTSGLVSLKAAGIEDFGDLEGKKYATWGLPAEQAIIRTVMAADGGDYEKLELVYTSVTDVVSAMQTGEIDTVWVYEAWDLIAVAQAGLDYNYIAFADAAPQLDYYTPVLVANDSFLKNDPETAKKFLAATQKGYEYAIAHPDEAADILCKAVPELDAEMVKASQQFLAAEYKAEKSVWGPIDEARWQTFYDWMYSEGLSETELGNKGFTNDYLPQ